MTTLMESSLLLLSAKLIQYRLTFEPHTMSLERSEKLY
jgi:hypothetical protein